MKIHMNNKGFSLVELIIVIAVMAILAGALVPAVLKYIYKSKRSADISRAGILQSAMQTAASGEENAYQEMCEHDGVQPFDTWNPVPGSLPDNEYWKCVDADVSGGLDTYAAARTNRLAPVNGVTVTLTNAKFFYKVSSSSGEVAVGIGENANQVYECVPTLCPEMDGRKNN